LDRDVIIVGAGIAGLTTAIYAQRSGLNVTLVEQHGIVGGICTSWKRKGYLFEGAIHWLTGSSPKTDLYQIWKETGALGDKVPVLYKDPFHSVDYDGQVIHLYRDMAKTVQHLSSVSPEDGPKLQRLLYEVNKLCKMQMPLTDVKGVKSENPRRMAFGNLFGMLPALPLIAKYNKISSGEFADQFTHPGIRRLFRIVFDEYDASSAVFTLATLHAGDGGYPEGGSLPMTDRMARTFMDLGGKLLLKSKVQKVVIRDGKAVGIMLNGSEMKADAVVVTQETIAALGNLFDEAPRDAWLAELRRSVKPAACAFVSIGVKTVFGDGVLPEWKLDKPIVYAGKNVDGIYFYSYPRHAPEGCTALTTALFGDAYDYWKKAKDEGRYEDEKQKLADQVTGALCDKYPQCKGNIEVTDVATPLTYERYTGAYHGSWMSVTGPNEKKKQYQGDCESVAGLYFAGHRMMLPGGLPVAAASGRTAAQLLCRQFGATFR